MRGLFLLIAVSNTEEVKLPSYKTVGIIQTNKP